MDALLFALVGCLIGTLGDKSQRFVLALAERFDRDGPLILAILLACAANAAISATAGAFIGPLMAANARLLFLALALLFMAVGMLWPISDPDPLDGWRIGAFLTMLLGFFILQFGDGQQFLILGLATRTADPVLAGIGGAIGTSAGLIPVVIGRRALLEAVPLRMIRRALGGLILLIGLACAASALGRL
jgi:putative Ca2+/H+ antiporter (TMEM165/GDT1 family)